MALRWWEKGLWQICMHHWTVHGKVDFPKFPPDASTGGYIPHLLILNSEMQWKNFSNPGGGYIQWNGPIHKIWHFPFTVHITIGLSDERSTSLPNRRLCIFQKQPGKWDLKWRPRHRIVHIECNGHFIHIKNQATGKIWSCNVTDIILEPPIEFWNIDTQFGRAGRYINHPTNLPTIKLTDN